MAEQSQQFAKNEQVDQMIDQYIKDNPKSLDYYTKAVKKFLKKLKKSIYRKIQKQKFHLTAPLGKYYC